MQSGDIFLAIYRSKQTPKIKSHLPECPREKMQWHTVIPQCKKPRGESGTREAVWDHLVVGEGGGGDKDLLQVKWQ